MLEEKDNKDLICFEVSSKTKDIFNLSLKILNLSKEEAFDRFMDQLLRDCSRSYYKNSSNVSYLMTRNNERLESRIRRWAFNKKGIYYFIIRSYLLALNDNDNETGANVEKMEEIFSNYISNNGKTISRFKMNFRLLCSDAPKAYGKLFDYNKETKVVKIDKNYIDLINELKKDFLVKDDELYAL